MSDQMAIEVVEYEKRIAEFLPGSQLVPKPIRLAMAQVAIAHGLDPFLKEVWPIPQKNRNGEITGWDLMIGIAGWRSAAWRSNEYWGRRFEKCSAEERGWLGAQQNDIALKCIVMRRRTGQQPMEFDGYGLFKAGHEFTKMNPLQCARYRAERDAMKAAFPISIPAGVNAHVADEATGEEINGEIDHGPKWERVTTDPAEPPIEQHADNHGLIDAAEAALKSGVIDMDGEPDKLRSAIAEEKERKTYRMARVVFNGMTPDQWHALADKFCADNPNWQTAQGKPDMNHVLASAGHAGYETITSDNISDVFDAIVGNHAARAKA